MEVDETYFGGPRKGKRGQGTGGKVPVCGLLAWWKGIHKGYT